MFVKPKVQTLTPCAEPWKIYIKSQKNGKNAKPFFLYSLWLELHLLQSMYIRLSYSFFM
jgi:hypothetical protein